MRSQGSDPQAEDGEDAATQADLESLRTLAHKITATPALSMAVFVEVLSRLLTGPHRVRAVRLLDEVGLVRSLLPELLEMKGLPQGPPSAPTGDLWEHVLLVLMHLGLRPSFPLALAALLHDVGKRRTLGRTPDRYTFYYHEHVGRRMAQEVCRRLCLPVEECDRVAWLVEKHQILCDVRQMRPAKLQRLLAHPGIHELVALHRADALASGRSTEHVDYCERLLRSHSPAPLE